jgi:hypothetical protein
MKTRKIPLLLSATLLSLTFGLSVGAGTFTDNFNAPHNFLTDGMVGSQWEGLMFGANQGNPVTTADWDAGITDTQSLTIRSTGGAWNAANDGPFMWKMVTGDFNVKVYISAFTTAAYNCAGLMARNPDTTNGQNYFYLCYFGHPEWSADTIIRNTINSATTEIDNVPSGSTRWPSPPYWLQIIREGNTFNGYASTNGTDYEYIYSTERTDMPDQIQVGIFQATYSGEQGLAQLRDYVLVGPNVNPSTAPSPAKDLTVTTTGGNLNLSWTPGAGTAGSLVVMRKDQPITRQPSYGVPYTGDANFGQGASLGDGNYVVYAGTGTNVAVAVPGGFKFYFAVYSYSGAGALINYNLSNPPAGDATSTANLDSLALDVPTNLVMYASAQVTVTAIYANGLKADVTALASFSSDAPQVVSVTAGGLVIAQAHSSATITATYGGKSTGKLVTVSDPVPGPLIHRYSFNEAAGTMTLSDSIGGAEGTITGLVEFDGSQGAVRNPDPAIAPAQSYVTLPENLMTNLQSITVETWVTDNGSGTWARIFDFGASYAGPGTSDGGSNYLALVLPDGGGGLRALYGYDPSEINFSTERPAVNKKSHVVFTSYAPAHTAFIYVDGKLAAADSNWYIPGTTNPATPAALGPTFNNWIGRSQYNDPGFNGTFDEFRIYDGSLSALQILINSVVGPDQTNLAPGALSSVVLTVDSPTMKKNGTQQASVIANFATVNGVPLTSFPDTVYTSSDPSVVAVDAQGKLTSFNKVGPATITASYGGMNSSQPVTVVPFDSTGYGYNLQITFNGYNQAETLTNFPALVTISPSISGFNYSQFLSPNAADLRFSDAAGNELSYEIEKWDSTGTSFVWVQVPLLSRGSSITMFWGKSGLTAPDYSTNGSTWKDGFLGVWHMTTNYVTDASGNGRNATAIVMESAVTTVDGVIGLAQNYNASTGNGATSVGNIKPGSTTTLSAWVWLTEQNREGIFMCKDGNFFFWQQGLNLRHERSPWGGDTVIPISATGGAAPSQGDWFHMAGTINGTTEQVYINGQLVGTWTKTPDAINDNQWQIGGVTWGRIMNGNLDECRVESVSRSPAWIWACWKNQSAPSQFATLSTAYRTGAPLALAEPNATLTGTSAILGARVVSDGGVTVTSWGTVWGTTPSPTGNSLADAGSRRAPFAFSQERSGFNPGTHYYFRGWASNSVSGVVYSSGGEFYTKPTPASAVAFTGVYSSQLTVNWAPTTAAGYLVAFSRAPLTAHPLDGVTYTANSLFGFGPTLDVGQYVVYSGSATNVTVNNLMPNTTYYVAVYAYAGSGSQISYAATAALASQATGTTPVPTGVVSADALLTYGPVAYWRFNEKSGAIAADSAGGFAGQYNPADVLGQPGPRPADGFSFETENTGVTLPGTDGTFVTLPALNLNSANATILCWVKPSGVQQDRAGIYTYSATGRSGMRYAGTTGNLGCLWAGSVYNSDSLAIPADAWTLVAMTVNPTNLTLYIDNASGGLKSQTFTGTFPVQAFDGVGYVGNDSNVGGRNFTGIIDEMAVFKTTLTAGEIQNIYAGVGGRTELTISRSGNNVLIAWPAASSGFDLQWTPLISPATWNKVTATPVVDGGMNTVTLPTTNSSSYYRLAK